MIYYICNREDKENCLGNACLEYCYHGRPHQADECTGKEEWCHVDCGYVWDDRTICEKSILIKCRPATKKELEMYGMTTEA